VRLAVGSGGVVWGEDGHEVVDDLLVRQAPETACATLCQHRRFPFRQIVIAG
jgi:hypothetical protein